MDAHHDIVRLTNDYAFYNDTFQVDLLVGLFAPDAVYDMGPVGLGRLVGQNELRVFFEREARAVRSLAHFTTNHRIDIDGDRATGTVYHHAIGVIRRSGARNELHGYYDDAYVRIADRWRFASRRLVPLLPHPRLSGASPAATTD
jgi:hypothetical protein